MDDVAGIDVERVSEWLATRIDDLRAPFTFELIAGGRSNLTFAVSDATGRRVVLRRPPMSHVLASAHDMAREHRIISALRTTSVPVPRALGLCTDDTVNGAPFYVMAFAAGSILRVPAEVATQFDEGQRRAIAHDLIDVLVDIHGLDVDAVGLGDLARRDGYVERQLKRWHGQLVQSQAQQADVGLTVPDYGLEEMHRRLAARIPAQGPATIAHADYRLDNTMIGDDARVSAVLDWELCTLGDPLADLGTFVMYWHEAGDGDAANDVFSVTALPGFPTRTELVDRYATRSGRDVSALPYFVAFANWRLACIMDGVRARYAGGAMGDRERANADSIASMVMVTAQRAHAALDEL